MSKAPLHQQGKHGFKKWFSAMLAGNALNRVADPRVRNVRAGTGYAPPPPLAGCWPLPQHGNELL
jgi:hypothetical protein